MILRQIPHDDLGCASYLVGDQRAGVAAVVDPRWEIDAYVRLADYFDVRITHVLETHIHADHVSGHGRLAAATGATIHLHAASGATFPHEPFEDGWELELGSVLVRALHTAGHRPEQTAFVLCDSARASQPWAVLTGDSLFVGSVARPDLAIEPTEGARQIWASLHERLLALAPETEVWPAHLGGSLCGGAEMDVKTSSTIGFEREHNAWLLEPDVESFTARVLAGLQPQPPNFRAIVEINKGPLLVEGVSVDTLSVNELRSRRDAGALIVNVRSAIAWDGGHIGGSLALPIGHTGFGTRLAWLAPTDAEVLLVGDDEAHAREAVALANAVAVRNVGGVLAGGIDAWRAAGGEARGDRDDRAGGAGGAVAQRPCSPAARRARASRLGARPRAWLGLAPVARHRRGARRAGPAAADRDDLRGRAARGRGREPAGAARCGRARARRRGRGRDAGALRGSARSRVNGSKRMTREKCVERTGVHPSAHPLAVVRGSMCH